MKRDAPGNPATPPRCHRSAPALARPATCPAGSAAPRARPAGRFSGPGERGAGITASGLGAFTFRLRLPVVRAAMQQVSLLTLKPASDCRGACGTAPVAALNPGAAGGEFTLTVGMANDPVVRTTQPLAHDATAQQVEDALKALPNIAAVHVTRRPVTEDMVTSFAQTQVRGFVWALTFVQEQAHRAGVRRARRCCLSCPSGRCHRRGERLQHRHTQLCGVRRGAPGAHGLHRLPTRTPSSAPPARRTPPRAPRRAPARCQPAAPVFDRLARPSLTRALPRHCPTRPCARRPAVAGSGWIASTAARADSGPSPASSATRRPRRSPRAAQPKMGVGAVEVSRSVSPGGQMTVTFVGAGRAL